MSFEIKFTPLPGFGIQYNVDSIKRLNQVVDGRHIMRGDLPKVGALIPEFIGYFENSSTRDGYVWFCRLDFRLGLSERADIAVLFPWHQDGDPRNSHMDRSVNVYSKIKLPEKEVSGLLDRIAAEYPRYSRLKK